MQACRKDTDLGPLAGAFRELTTLSDKDLAAAKQIWTRRLGKRVW